jgi:hypothetical protein
MWTYEFYHAHFGWLRVDREWSSRLEVEQYTKSNPYKIRIIKAD